MPQSEIVPEHGDMSKVVGFITDTEEPVVVQRAGDESLPGHIDEVILGVELEVDLLVVRFGLLAWLAHHQDLKRVLARLQVDPDCFS